MYRTSSLTSKIALFSAIGAAVALCSIAQATPVITGVSGAVSQGGVLTISGSAFGVKSPAKPYLWAPMNGTLSPSSLGVITSWVTTGQLSYQNGCGPAAGTGCASGTPSNGVDANNWTASIYSPSYYSASGNDWNSYGQKTYVYRKSKKTFSYYNDPTKNVKNIRMWGNFTVPVSYISGFLLWHLERKVGGRRDPPEGNQRLHDARSYTTSRSRPGKSVVSEEFEIASNSGPTTANGDFRLAINGGGWLCQFPNTQWEENTVTLKTASGYGGDGTKGTLSHSSGRTRTAGIGCLSQPAPSISRRMFMQIPPGHG